MLSNTPNIKNPSNWFLNSTQIHQLKNWSDEYLELLLLWRQLMRKGHTSMTKLMVYSFWNLQINGTERYEKWNVCMWKNANDIFQWRVYNNVFWEGKERISYPLANWNNTYMPESMLAEKNSNFGLRGCIGYGMEINTHIHLFFFNIKTL